MENILIVPMDGSNSSLSALYFAIETVKKDPGKIVLLNVQRKYEDLHHDSSTISANEISRLQVKKGLKVLESAQKIVTEKNVPLNL